MNGRGQRIGRSGGCPVVTELFYLRSPFRDMAQNGEPGNICTQKYEIFGLHIPHVPPIVWSPCNGGRDLWEMLFKSLGLAVETLTALKVQIVFYGLKYYTWSYLCLLLLLPLQPHWPPSSPSAPTRSFLETFTHVVLLFPLLATRASWLTSCHSDLCPRSLSRRSFP